MSAIYKVCFYGCRHFCLEVSLKVYIFAYIRIQRGKIYCLTLSIRKSTYPFLADGNKAGNNVFRFYFVGTV